MYIRSALALTLSAGLAATAVGQMFNAGNLVILQGNNAGTNGNVNSSGAAVTLLEFSTLGVATGDSVALASSGTGQRLVFSGSSTTEGQLQWSADGSRLVMAGYSGNVNQFGTTGTNSIATLNTTALPRMAAGVDVNGNVNYLPITNSFSGNNIRSAASFDGQTLFVAGTNQPIRTVSSATSPNANVFSSGGAGSWRTVNVYNGAVYASTQTGTAGGGAPYTGIYQFDGTGAASLLPGMPLVTGTGGPSPVDFMFVSSTTMYIADDRTLANGGGLQRWDNVGGLWSLSYTMNANLLNGLRSLTIDPTTNTIYAIAANPTNSAGGQTSLVSVVDAGPGSSFTTLATSQALTVWRGVEWIPTPGAGALLGMGMVAMGRRRRA